jgi:chromosome partitioning protein
MRIAVVNTKGGVGKTTLAVHLATMFESQQATLLIDGDPQASAASWKAWRSESSGFTVSVSPTTVCLAGRAVYTEGVEVARQFAHTVIDAGGRDSASLRAALLLAERAIVPVGASTLDAAALTDLLEIADLARELNPQLRLRVLLSRIDPRTRDAGDMLAYLAEQRLEVLDARICERVAYRRAVGDGLTVDELTGARRDEVAALEMRVAFEEITR